MDLSNEIVLHKKQGNKEFLQFKKLLKYSDIISHAYSVGINENYRTFNGDRTPLSTEKYEKNMKNYQELCEANNLNYENIVKANQKHTDNVQIVDKIINNKEIDTKEYSDGLITNKKNIVLATTNADCILLLFFDTNKRVIANTHSGWKGTLQEISVKTVKKME